MKLRRRLVLRQLLFLLAAALAAFSARTARADTTITLRGTQPQPASILGVTPQGVRVQLGAGTLVEPFANIVAISMPAPPEYAAALAAFSQGQLQTAFTNASALVSAYRGLPVDWARDSMRLVADIQLALGQIPQAEAALRDFQRAYPGSSSADLNVSLAQLDVAKKDFASASKRIGPILNPALQQRNLPRDSAALAGRAFLVSGQIKEAAGDLPGALQDYLRTVVIFPQDRIAASSARQHADALRKANPSVMVP